MKQNSIYPFAQTRMAAAAILLTCAPLAYAAPAAEKKAASEDKAAEKADKAKETETATGRVFSYEPEVLSVILEGNTTPVRFQVNKETPYVDEDGKAVPLELIRPEIPLTVHYHTAGSKNEDMIAEKVVFTRAMVADAPNEPVSEKREKLAAETEKDQESKAREQSTAPESVSGTIFTVEQTVTLRPHGSSEPKTFVLNNSTRFVDSSGSPVSGGVLFSGVPVSVRSIPDGSRHIAQEIMVRGELPSAQGVAGGSGGTATSGGKTASGGRNGNRNNKRGNNNNNNGSVAGTGQLGTVVPIAPGQPGYVGGNQGQLPGQGGENTGGGDADTIPNLGDTAAGGTNTNQNPGNGNGTATGNGNTNGGNNGTTNPNNNGSSNGNTNGGAQPGKPNQTPGNQPNPDNKPAPANPSNPTSPATGGSGSGNQGGGNGTGSGGTGGAASGSGSTSSGGNTSGGSGAGAGSTGTGTGSAR